MRRVPGLISVLVFAGCDFAVPAMPAEGPDPDPEDPPTQDPAPPVAAACDVDDPALRLCLTFDHTPMVQDLASPAVELATSAGVDPVPGLDSTAIRLDSRSTLRFAESSDLDVADLTLDLWIEPTRRPMNNRFFWLFDNDDQYAAVIDDDGRVWCGIGDAFVQHDAELREGWHHVACRYDSTRDELRIYVDGSAGGCRRVDALPTRGASGLAIGADFRMNGYHDNFIGHLDGLHLYARPLSDAEICAAAGRSGCSAVCQSGGGGGDGGGDGDGDGDGDTRGDGGRGR